MQKTFIILVSLVFLMYCAGSKPDASWTATNYYKVAKDKFDDEDYFEAVSDFTVVLLRFAGSSVADSAQYFLAECHYKMGEYLIAGVEFERLITTMSQSSLVPKAQLRLAESYFELSPRAELDQEYTLKAIREYQNFVEEFPTHPKKEKAEKKITFLRDRLAKKEYENAEIYRKMSEYKAAIIYYDQVLNKYYDSEWVDDALLGKVNTYIDAEDPENARLELAKFEEQFPNSGLKEDLDDFKKELGELEQELAKE